MSEETWQFDAKPNQPLPEWRWRLIDHAGKAIRESTRSFPNLSECVGDAQENGYAGQAPAEKVPTSEFGTS